MPFVNGSGRGRQGSDPGTSSPRIECLLITRLVHQNQMCEIHEARNISIYMGLVSKSVDLSRVFQCGAKVDLASAAAYAGSACLIFSPLPPSLPAAAAVDYLASFPLFLLLLCLSCLFASFPLFLLPLFLSASLPLPHLRKFNLPSVGIKPPQLQLQNMSL